MRGNPALLRQLNERRVLNATRLLGQVSRVDLQKELRLTLPTVSRIVDYFIEREWLRSVGIGDSKGGRRPQLVEINPGGAKALGIELGRDSVRAVVTDLLGQPLSSQKWATHEFIGPRETLSAVAEFFDVAVGQTKDVIGLGIGAPGPLDPVTGHLQSPEDMPSTWHAVPIVEIASDILQIPVWLENDANAAALGESWFGNQHGVNHAVFILADAGLGSGVVINGSVYPGASGMAGEFSHMTVDIDGEQCTCGRRGCVNNVSSLYAIRRAISARREMKSDETFDAVVSRAKLGLEPDSSVLKRAIQYLALGVSNLVQFLDPNIVILGGEIVLTDDFVACAVQQAVQELVRRSDKRVMITSFGEDAVAVGAATLALQSVYDYKTLVHE